MREDNVQIRVDLVKRDDFVVLVIWHKFWERLHIVDDVLELQILLFEEILHEAIAGHAVVQRASKVAERWMGGVDAKRSLMCGGNDSFIAR